MKTLKELFVEGVYNSQTSYPGPRIGVDQARQELEEMKVGAYDVPDGITPEEYAELWNDLVDADEEGAVTLQTTEEDLLIIRRALEAYQIGLERYIGKGKEASIAPGEVARILEAIEKARKH